MKQTLSNREQKIVRAFAEVIIPLDAKSREMDLTIEKIGDHLKFFSKDMRLAWRASILLLEFAAFFYYGKCKTMTMMDPVLRGRYADAWHHTRWSVKRTIKRFIETVISTNYYALPDVCKRIGYTPKFKPPHVLPETPLTNLIREFPKDDIECEADVCIVGSGAGGASAAWALAEAGRKVVVIEEGGWFDVSDFGEDAITMTKRLYRAGGLINTFGWPPILLPLGLAVGGTTVINSGTCFRTPPKVFQWWADRFGLATWTAERMDTYYKRVEEVLQVEEARDEVQAASGRIFARGTAHLNFDVKPMMRNAPGCCGSGVCSWGCPTNAKRSLQISVIPKALEAGARIYTHAKAEYIRFERHHATEVQARFIEPLSRVCGPKLRVKAKVVVVACGTLHTPVVLGRSGIPNPSGQRGRNLTIHPATKVFALMDEEVRGWDGIPQGFYSDALSDEGIKLEGIFLSPSFTASTILLTGREHYEAMERYNNLAVFGMLVSDTTRGRVVRGIGGHPIPLYTINREDLPKYQRGITYLAEAFFAAGAKKVFVGIHTMPVVTREDGAQAIARLKLRNKDLDLQAFHPLGTCRMGADPREAVADPTGRVYGLDNLFVADGSIFPTALGVNPQMTIMAAALKIADYINREYL